VKTVAPAKAAAPAAQTAALVPPTQTPAPAEPAPPGCRRCGTVEEIKTIKADAEHGSGLGAVIGGLAGIVVGNQIGQGNGKVLAKVAGAAGGAYVGNRVEKRVRATTSYEVRVRLDNGTETTVTQEVQPAVAVGDPVKIVNGRVVAR
jgi:outer membrane lipoprotein SlyB